MGKALYSKPSFQVHLSTLSGTGGGCNIAVNNEAYKCPVFDEGSGLEIFAENTCQTQDPAGYGGCPIVPYNDGNTFHS